VVEILPQSREAKAKARFVLKNWVPMPGCLGWTIISCVALALFVSAAPRSPATETPVLWRDPAPLETKDLYWGPGSPNKAPKPPFFFVKEDRSGTKPKIQVTDANGMLWTAKFASKSRTGTEVHAEIAASRLMWALGYFVEEHYFVSDGVITGVHSLRRRTSDVLAPNGSFRAARFERRPPGISRGGRWDLDNNSFAGSRELSGLKILAMLVNNWDARLGNTGILRVPIRADEVEARHILSDLGTAFGRMAHAGGKGTRWNLAHYQHGAFIRGIKDDTLVFCHGLDAAPQLSVPVEHARWVSALASQLNPAQVRRAFEAAGAKPDDIDGFSTVVMRRVAQLRAVLDGHQVRAGCLEEEEPQ
jgi:hypothetical protein